MCVCVCVYASFFQCSPFVFEIPACVTKRSHDKRAAALRSFVLVESARLAGVGIKCEYDPVDQRIIFSWMGQERVAYENANPGVRLVSKEPPPFIFLPTDTRYEFDQQLVALADVRRRSGQRVLPLCESIHAAGRSADTDSVSGPGPIRPVLFNTLRERFCIFLCISPRGSFLSPRWSPWCAPHCC